MWDRDGQGWGAGEWWGRFVLLLFLLTALGRSWGQGVPAAVLTPEQRAERFVAGRRTMATGGAAARAMASARVTARAMPRLGEGVAGAGGRGLQAHTALTSGLGAPWTPVGPASVQSLRYGAISGRVTAVAVDPADASGNTVYVGTTGGGVWKSTNAAGAQVSFQPMTDDLPVFSNSAGSTTIPSLSIGALAALPGGVLLAGTGDPNDAADSYYGAGLLRSLDGGLTWSLVTTTNDGVAGFHNFFGLGFAGFAYATTNPQLVVAAVSQSAWGLLVNAGKSNSVLGLYFSTDAGATWQMATLMDGADVLQAPTPSSGVLGNAATAVVWNPVRQRFVAAVRYHGYYESADGMTWTRLAAQPGSGLTLRACPTVSGPQPTCPLFRGALAVNATTGDTFALTTDLADGDVGLFQDVCGRNGRACSDAEPTFGQMLDSTALQAGSGSTTIAQADYNLALTAVPVAAAGSVPADTVLLVGTTDVYRCSVGAGCTLRNTTNAVNGCNAPAAVAPAQHAIVADAAAGAGVVFFGNDGGLWRTTDLVNQQGTACSADDATHFQNLNAGLGPLGEVVAVAQDPTDAGIVLAGLGGMGTAATTGASATAWQQLSAAEGGGAAIDQTNPAQWYVSTASGVSVAACGNGASCTAGDVLAATPVGPAQMGGDVALMDAPWMLDPAAPGSLLAGTCRVWRGPAADASAWTASDALSTMISGPQGASCTVSNGLVSALGAGGAAASGVATAGSGVLYAGMAGLQAGGGAVVPGHVFAQTSANTAGPTTAWADVTAGNTVTNETVAAGRFNPGMFSVSAVVVDAHDATGRTVYATVEGFSGNGVSVAHVYRSTDAGAHWTILSANLPNAPANALVIDPNDANTVYVATDAGVYATTAVTTCAVQNCWSALGAGLPQAPVTVLVAGAEVPTGDGRIGMLRAGTYGRGVWQTPLLTASTIQRPVMSLTPTALQFAKTSVGATTAAQAVVVTNNGTAPLVVSRVGITSSNAPVGVQTLVTDFVLSVGSDTCSGQSVPVGGTCSLSVAFAPSGVGLRSSTLTLYGNVTGGQSTMALTGTAVVGPAVTLTPTSLAFPLTTLGSRSYVQNVVLANTGGTTVTVGSAVVTGADFLITANTCGSSLASQTSCTISMVFAPATTGLRTGTLAVKDGLGTQTVTMAGTAQTPATDALSATALGFSTTPVGQKSGVQQLVLTNAGDLPLTLVATSGASADFAVTNSCGNSVSGHSACIIGVQFVPHSVGVSTTTLTVADVFRTQAVTLTGTGVAPAGVSLLPAGTMLFGAVGVGQSSTAGGLTLTNNGGLPLVISSVTLTGDFGLAVGSGCGASLGVGQACTLQVLFSPKAAGARTGSITVTDNSPGSPQTVALAGTGVDFQLALNSGSASATIGGASGSAGFPLIVTSTAGSIGTAALSCTGTPANASCVLSAQTVTLGGSTVVTATVATGQSAAPGAEPNTRPNRRSSTAPLAWGASGAALAMLLPLWGVRRRGTALRPGLLALLLVLVPLGMAGCGGTPRTMPGDGSSGGGAAGPPTPAGTYSMVVTATSAGLSRAVTLTVTVQ